MGTAVHDPRFGAKRAVLAALFANLGDKEPDEEHPLCFGRERYFWAFIVALSIFTLGGGLSVREGLSKIGEPHEIERRIRKAVPIARRIFIAAESIRSLSPSQ